MPANSVIDSKFKGSIFSAKEKDAWPISKHELFGGKYFAGYYASEHVAATEFVFGIILVTMGVSARDIFWGLLIGNFLAVLSWALVTAPIAVETRLTLYWYIRKIAGRGTTLLYNAMNVIVFTIISGAMITASISALRVLFNIPVQLKWYPESAAFVILGLILGIAVVAITIFGFKAVAMFSTLCGPWLFFMFTAGALVALPYLANHVSGVTHISSFSQLFNICNTAVWDGVNSNGHAGIGLLGVIGLAWAGNSFTHFGLIDMAVFRYAKKSSYGMYTACGMYFGHFLAWMAAGIMGTSAALLLSRPLSQMDPGDVAFSLLGYSGIIILIIGGWTTANANLYRAGLAAEAIFHKFSRQKVTLVVGIFTAIISCFPFVFTKAFQLVTYSGIILVPIGGIVFAEHWLFPRIGLTRYWSYYKNEHTNWPAVGTWLAALVFSFAVNYYGIISYQFIFIFEWGLSILLYILLSLPSGSKEKYSEEQARDEQVMEAIKTTQEADYQQTLSEDKECSAARKKAKSKLTSIVHKLAWLCLIIIGANAMYVFFFSSDIDNYMHNFSTFKIISLIATILYFTLGTATQLLQRKDVNS
ncbi:hypothetical protein P0136_04870 [Lentisphaerota bacterium ZTH]|nr:hypothetical protein JYG24_04010 [Lentisphaerota bacterium]WET07322.1 hypothetical protein P0136_04870 [Lentisphaerota bacterium ZTH]